MMIKLIALALIVVSSAAMAAPMRLAKTLLAGQKLLDRRHRFSTGWLSAIQERLDSIYNQVARSRAELLARIR